MHTSVPLVLLGEQEMSARYAHVRMDNVGGARLATAHLLAAGARRIAVVGGAEPSAEAGMMPARTLGWSLAHDDAGVQTAPELIVRAPADLASGRDAVRRIVREGLDLDAVLAVTDSLAVGVLAGLAEAGRRVPDDVQVVGFDNLASSEFTVPALSTVDPGHEWLATETLRLLEAAIARGPAAAADGAADVPQHVTAPARLVLRGTTRDHRD